MRKINYQIAIPTHRRPETIRKKTLAYLAETNVNMRNVSVFVPPDQLDDYAGIVNEFAVKIKRGVHGLAMQRAVIHNSYPVGTPIFQIDDDIESLEQFVDVKTTRPVYDLDKIIQTGFQFCEAFNTKLWGINAVLNPYFMGELTTTNLRYIVGCAFGIIANHDPDLDVVLEDKEDFERTIKYYHRFGTVVRLNYIAPKTNYYTEPGGMQIDRTERRIIASAKLLAKRWPQYCRLKKGGRELRLHHYKNYDPKQLNLL